MNMVSRASNLSLPLANESSRLSDLSASAAPALNTRKTPNIWSRDTIVVAGMQAPRSQICVQVPSYDADEAVATCMTRFCCNARSATEKRFAR
jgi:hypothetical protein